MFDIKYIIRMDVLDTRIERPFLNTTGFNVYDTIEEALVNYHK